MNIDRNIKTVLSAILAIFSVLFFPACSGDDSDSLFKTEESFIEVSFNSYFSQELLDIADFTIEKMVSDDSTYTSIKYDISSTEWSDHFTNSKYPIRVGYIVSYQLKDNADLNSNYTFSYKFDEKLRYTIRYIYSNERPTEEYSKIIYETNSDELITAEKGKLTAVLDEITKSMSFCKEIDAQGNYKDIPFIIE